MKRALDMRLKKINAIVMNTIKVFSRTQEKVLHKFLMDAIKGIIISRSINLSKISRAIEGDSETT